MVSSLLAYFMIYVQKRKTEGNHKLFQGMQTINCYAFAWRSSPAIILSCNLFARWAEMAIHSTR